MSPFLLHFCVLILMLDVVSTLRSSHLHCAMGTFENKAGDCESCHIGSYCINNVKLLCPPGSAQHLTGESSCETCEAGWHSTAPGTSKCVPCFRGMFCSTTTMASECPIGTYQPKLAQTHCLPCPAGSYQSKTGSTFCHQCPIGHGCMDGAMEPSPCGPGSYQDMEGGKECRTCAPGLHQWSMYGTQCTECPPRHTCAKADELPQFTRIASPLSNDNVCQPGYYRPSFGPDACKPCPAGYKCVNDLLIACAPGWYQDLRGQTTCKRCAAGYIAQTRASTKCVPCPSGNHCFQVVNAGGGDNVTFVTACHPGSYSHSAWMDCELAPAGKFIAKPQAANPTSCYDGYFCRHKGTINQMACPNGNYVWCMSETGCNQCPSGANTGIGQWNCNKNCDDVVGAAEGCATDLLGNIDKDMVIDEVVETGCVLAPEFCPLVILGGIVASHLIGTAMEDPTFLSDVDAVGRTIGHATAVGVCPQCFNVDTTMAIVRAQKAQIDSMLAYSQKSYEERSDGSNDGPIHTMHEGYTYAGDLAKLAGTHLEGWGGRMGPVLDFLDNADCRKAGMCLLHKIFGRFDIAPPLSSASTLSANLTATFESRGHIYIASVLQSIYAKFIVKYDTLFQFMTRSSSDCHEILLQAMTITNDDDQTALISSEEETNLFAMCINETTNLGQAQIAGLVMFTNNEIKSIMSNVVERTIVGSMMHNAIEATSYLPNSFTHHPIAADFATKLKDEMIQKAQETKVCDGTYPVNIPYKKLLPYKAYVIVAQVEANFRGSLYTKLTMPVDEQNVRCTPIDIRATTLDVPTAVTLPMITVNEQTRFTITGLNGTYVSSFIANGPVRYVMTCKF